MPNYFQTISPVDGSVYVERPLSNANDIDKVLANAQKAQREWEHTKLEERQDICRKAVDYLVERADTLGQEISWQMGRPVQYAPFEISAGFRERAEYMIDIAKNSLADIQVEKKDGFQRFIRRAPVGIVLVLAPWNYPYLTSVNVVIPALLAGNVVILKHAQQTPLCAERYAEAFEAAGLPKNVFQYLHISHEHVREMITDDRIHYVAFTGSVKGGKAIQAATNQRFIATGLELGGKDPAYVRPDANLEFALENLVDGTFFNSGQSCCGIERIYVHESLFHSFLEGFVALTKQYKLGNPLDPETTLGPMVRSDNANFARLQIKKAVAMGAKALISPDLFPMQKIGSPYMAPQVLINVDHSMAVMQEESFAPVVGIMPVKNDEEAIQLMNDSQYGLTASIWSADVERALEIGNQLETGTCYLNRCDYLDPALAWTGVKNSGRGSTLSRLGYEALTRPKSFHLRMV